MQINITNGTLTQIQETLSPASGYSLPSSITVTGAISSYSDSTGAVTLTSLTSTMSLTAVAEAQPSSGISFGNLPISKILFGNVEIQAMYYGNVKLYEGGSSRTL